MIAVDDAHWADEPSLRWLAHLAPRLEGLAIAPVVALRPGAPTALGASLTALRADAPTILRPGLLSEGAVGAIVRAAAGGRASDGVLRFRDGRHVSFNLMFDRLLMLEQLGLVPAAAPAE